MGTMLEIVVGLLQCQVLAMRILKKAIDILIGGVKIAMIASFTGLLLTVVLSGWRYKGKNNSKKILK
jgi:hypothetical protein